MKLTRWPLAVIVALGMLGTIGAQPASADYIYQKVTIYGSDTNCTGGRAEISHGSGSGYAKADAYSWYAQWYPTVGNVHCGRDFARPPGYLAAAFDLYKWNGSAWALCQQTPWNYNTSQTHQWYVWTRYGSPPCGNGYYGTSALSYVWNNQWFGGSVWSGYHYLPA